MPVITASQAGGANRCAFLDMIAYSEIGPELLSLSDGGYNVEVGSTPQKPILFDSYADHPIFHNAALNSDAAGRYQQMGQWWFDFPLPSGKIRPGYKTLMGYKDFSPLTQDKCALQQIKEHGALPLIDAGKFALAIALVKPLWASLPGAGYGQHENDFHDLMTAYQSAGGTVSA